MRNLIDDKLLKFGVVGVINTIVGTGIMFILYNAAGCSYWVSSAANYIVGSMVSYVLNKNFTFRYQGDGGRSILRFIVNIAVCWLLAYGIAKPLAIRMLVTCSVTVQENVAMVIGMVLFVGLNYIGQRLFVFPDKKTM